MRKELLSIAIKMSIKANSPFREYCFSVLDNSMHKKDNSMVYAVLTFVLNTSSSNETNANTIIIEPRAYTKIKDEHNNLKLIETYVDEAINLQIFADLPDNVNPDGINVLLPCNITQTEANIINMAINSCDTPAEKQDEIWKFYEHALTVDFERYNFAGKIGNSLHFYSISFRYNNLQEALEGINRLV